MQPDNFDKQIREVLTNKHFAYDPAAWEQATALLDQQKRKKRLFWWIWPVLGMLLLTVVGAVQYARQSAPAVPITSLANPSATNMDDAEETGTGYPPNMEQAEAATKSTENTTDQTINGAGKQPSQSPFYSSKKTINSQRTKNPAAAIPAIDAANEAALVTYPLLQPRGIKKLQRIFDERSLSSKEVEAIPVAFFEQEKRNRKSFSIGLHGFGGTTLGSSESVQPFNYGGGIFVDMRYNKLFFAIEPTVNHIQGVGGVSSRNDTTYAFGQIIKTQTLSWNNLLLVQLPMVVGLEIHPKHTIAAGLIAQQYLQSNYTLSETTFRQGFPPSETSQTEGQARINSLFVPRFVGQIRYQYQLSPAFSMGLQYNLIASKTPSTMPSQLQFQLKYHLFNRSRQ